MCAISQSLSLMANTENAIFDRKATSGLQNVKTTVWSSGAVSDFRLPVYGRPFQVPAAQSTGVAVVRERVGDRRRVGRLS